MIILSFSKTTAAVKARRKSVTRREWNDAYAERFKRSIEKTDGLAQAWTASPHRGGKRFGTVKVLSVTKEPTREIPDSDWEAEGFAYMTEHGLNVEKDISCEKFWRAWRQHATKETWVVRFEVIHLDSEILDEPALEGAA